MDHQARDEQIYGMRADLGMPLIDIAMKHELSVKRVCQIIEDQKRKRRLAAYEAIHGSIP